MKRIPRQVTEPAVVPIAVERDPDLSHLPAEQEVQFLVQTYGMDEGRARFIVAIKRGEISGDTFEVGDADEARTA